MSLKAKTVSSKSTAATKAVGKPKRDPESIEITLTLSRETKGTFVYATEEEDAPIPTLYIRKSGLPKEAPEEITVTVNW